LEFRALGVDSAAGWATAGRGGADGALG